MTAAQISALSAFTGDWSEALPERYGGKAMFDDGSLGGADELPNGIPSNILVILKGGKSDQPRAIDSVWGAGHKIDRNSLHAPNA